MTGQGTPIDVVYLSWGNTPPNWVLRMGIECYEDSQAAVARQIHYSPAAVNMVLKNRYSGDLSRVESAFRGAFMGATADCPVLGEIPTNDCLAHQRRPFEPTNGRRVALYRACRAGCSHSRIETEA